MGDELELKPRTIETHTADGDMLHGKVCTVEARTADGMLHGGSMVLPLDTPEEELQGTEEILIRMVKDRHPDVLEVLSTGWRDQYFVDHDD